MKKKMILLVLAACLILGAGSLVSAFGDDYDKYKIFYEGKNTGTHGFYVKGNVYIPVSMIGSYFKNPNISVNQDRMELVMTVSNLNILMADDEVTRFVKDNCGTVYVPLKKLDDVICFSLNVMEQFYNMSYDVDENTIKLKGYSGTEKIARAAADNVPAVVSLFSETGSDTVLSQGERVFIKGETDNYYKVEDFDSNIYYVAKNLIDIEDIDLSTVDFYAPKKTKFKQAAGSKINLAWQYVAEVTPQAPDSTPGIDIMAPTWFRLMVEGGGAVTNSGDKGYTDLCHENGFMVWATITNNMSETGSTNFTTKMFSDPSIQKTAIAQYLFYSCLYNVDGINIDFEDVKDADRNGLTAFTKEMRYYTERQGLNLSIDVMVPKPWNIEYDRAALSKYVDYIAVMSYDEHYAGSKIPGSISSLPFAEESVVACIEEGVPAEKLLMGVPLYTRVWVMDANGKIVSNGAATMDRINEILNEKNLSPSYLSREMQNYVEYQTDKGTAKIWIEDKTSITNRLSLVSTYNLAGSACWQYSQGSQEIWDVFDRYLH